MTAIAPEIIQGTSLHALFHPRTIAVAGVSRRSDGQGNKFIRRLREAGYRGAIYPIHPTEPELEGLRSYPSLSQTPEPIDYAFIAIPAEAVPAMLAEAAGRVRFAQVMSSGFGEGGRGMALRRALLDAVRKGGMRLLGPNCLGTYSPAAGMSFIDGRPAAPGSVGVFSQSGGLSVDIIRNGEYRGLRFSGVVSLGNCLDIGPCELLAHYLEDPSTRVIGAYIEDIREGRRFFEILRDARAAKPVVLLKGGRTAQGLRAAASHTGSLAGSEQVWTALAAQTGSILVDSLEDFINVLAAFESERDSKPPFDGRVVLFGNGGGASVLAADALGKLGVDVPALGAATAAALEALRVPAGAGLENPLDVPANILERSKGRIAGSILEAVITQERPGAVLAHINLPVIMGYRGGALLDELMQTVLGLQGLLAPATRLYLVLRSTGQADYEEKRRRYAQQAIQAGIPTFFDLVSAARALHALNTYSRYYHTRHP